MLPQSVRKLIASGPLPHVATLMPSGAAHVTLAWIGLDGDEVVFGTLAGQTKLRNIRRDPRIAISLRLARVYVGPDVVFPPMPNPPAGFITRMTVERVTGVGPWIGER